MDEIYDNATDWDLNTMKNNKLKIGLWGYFTRFWPTCLSVRMGERGKLETIRLI